MFRIISNIRWIKLEKCLKITFNIHKFKNTHLKNTSKCDIEYQLLWLQNKTKNKMVKNYIMYKKIAERRENFLQMLW